MGVFFIILNKKEVYIVVEVNLLENIDIVGEKLKEKYNLDIVLVIRSEEGMILYDKEIYNIFIYVKEVYDVIGVGDIVILVFILVKVVGVIWEEVVKIVNVVGGIVVGKIGIFIVSEMELIEIYNSIYSNN